MASINYFRLIIFFFLLSLFHLCSASNSETEIDYKKWISWNKDHYLKKKAKDALRTSMIKQAPAGSSVVNGMKVLDPKLRYAEMNKVIISVSQFGTGNFKTIKEALATIPLYNTGRVILDIGPGVYRYVRSQI